MKHIIGIVCEFNPFHNGHKYLIDEIKRRLDCTIVCVMSGNFVQRGDIAITEKFSRTEMALHSGADVIIELPVRFSLSSAESFAAAAVFLLQSFGCDYIAFGVENIDIMRMSEIAEYLISSDFHNQVSITDSQNKTFASLRYEIIKENFGENYSKILSKPNNILALEYLKANILLENKMKILPIQRINAEHDVISEISDTTKIISASQIRDLVFNNNEFMNFVPSVTYEILEKNIISLSCPTNIKNLERAIIAYLRTVIPEDLQKILDVNEGLENKIIKSALSSSSLDELYYGIKSKRYTLSRIRRVVLCAYLQIKKTDFNNLLDYIIGENNYIRILGFTESGRKTLSLITPTLPIVSSYADAKKLGAKAIAQYDFEAKCDSVYSIASPKINDGKTYYTHKLVRILK